MLKNSNKIYINKKDYYTVLKIKNRVICSPSDSLKKKQRFFLNAIKWVYPYKLNILELAKIHTGKKYILKMDIKEFFNSVPFKDIEEVIQNVLNRINKKNEIINYIILTTINNKLPTGAPTSPYIAEACFKYADKMIKDVSCLYNVDYTRYVDDLTFSSDNKERLNIIEKRVISILDDYGYKINPKKTKYIASNKQQNILGLIVNNNKTRLSNDFKRKTRAMLHQYCIYKLGISTGTNDLKYLVWNKTKERSLWGYFSYIKQVDKKYYLKLLDYKNKLFEKYFLYSTP